MGMSHPKAMCHYWNNEPMIEARSGAGVRINLQTESAEEAGCTIYMYT